MENNVRSFPAYFPKGRPHEELEAFMPWAPDVQEDCKIPNSDAYVNTYLE